MATILGIDPGSRVTGYGVINANGSQVDYIDSGCIRTDTEQNLPFRLQQIFEGIREVISLHLPGEVGVEQVFMARNADAALKLGQPRGAAIVACSAGHLPVSEYSARQVKQSVVGVGGAEKSQVQSMVVRLLNLDRTPQADAADALAVALCHFYTGQGLVRIAGARKVRHRRICS